jgi:hypothetical protein
MLQLNANALESLIISLWMKQSTRRWVGGKILCSQGVSIYVGEPKESVKGRPPSIYSPKRAIQPLLTPCWNRGHQTRSMPYIRQSLCCPMPLRTPCGTSHIWIRLLSPNISLHSISWRFLSNAHRTNIARCPMCSCKVQESNFGHWTCPRLRIGQVASIWCPLSLCSI